MEDLISRLLFPLQVTHLRPSAGSARAMDQDDSRRADTLPGHRYNACPHSRARLCTLLSGSGGSSPPPLGRSRGAGDLAPLQAGFWSLLSEARAQPGRSSETAAILVPQSRRGDTLFPPQPLFFARRRLLRVYRSGFRSLGLILPIIFRAWKCHYLVRAPFTAPERCAKRAGSSAAGHAPR
ncbi:hypothetical protein NDU88_002682 [Pleurodeles waltl]|uniref:Uncharacterized protein n=1 Tax=Pleurodeles waltl TaxID=8319 RepID=A0AAV7LD73_PLEWA|nr:hypothetical protein NDU88_002682 [Pleurodeles waltl]